MANNKPKHLRRSHVIALRVDGATYDRISRLAEAQHSTISTAANNLLQGAVLAELERLGLPADRPAESGEWLAVDPFAEVDDAEQARRLRLAGYEVEP